jgi:hypothetical protein
MCCGSLARAEAAASLLRDRIEASEKQRRDQQGHGRPIQSFNQNDGRIVVVGKRLFRSTTKTFHEFLFEYVGQALGIDWFRQQMQSANPHPAAGWANSMNADRRDQERSMRSACNGTRSLLAMAYNLYLIEHHYEQYNHPLLARLLKRLKEPDNFFPTLSETYAAAAFLKAGFLLEFEDDRSAGEHSEFVATHPKTGRKFSVEVKTRAGIDRSDTTAAKRFRISDRLRRALSKALPHNRVVWIDINIADPTPEDGKGWIDEIMSEVRSAESFLMISGQPAPPAYLFITNRPYHYNPGAIVGAPVIGALGFKIPDFQHPGPVTFRDIVLGKRTHSEMHELIDSLRRHTEPPATFDGSAPELAFGDASHLPPLLIGNQYLIPDGSGGETEGILQSALMVESEKRAYGIYRIAGERHVSVTTPMTDMEIAAWRRHPETFFGKVQPVTKQVESPLDLAEFMYETYRNTPKEKLLSFMQDHPNIGQLKDMSQDDLAILYSEQIAINAARRGDIPNQNVER